MVKKTLCPALNIFYSRLQYNAKSYLRKMLYRYQTLYQILNSEYYDREITLNFGILSL